MLILWEVRSVMKAKLYKFLLIVVSLFGITGSSLAGELIDVTVMPDDPTAGRNSAYYFAFTTSDTGDGQGNVGLPVDGQIKIQFPPEFTISSVLFASSQNSNMTGGLQVISRLNNTVTLQRDSTGNQVSGLIRVLIGVAMVQNPALVQSAQVTISTWRSDSTLIDQAVSDLWEIVPGEVDHFNIAPIGTQTAGAAFTLSIVAQDQENNTVSDFTGTANLMDLTGSLSTTSTGSFSNGQWSGQISITKAIANNRLTVTSIGKSGESNEFAVPAASLHHFSFEPVSSPQVAGAPFQVTIVARDEYENQVTDFQGSVNLTDLTGTIKPETTTNFINGSWQGPLTITRSQNDISIAAENGGKRGQSNVFNVNPAKISHFQIEEISTQAAGVYFPITVKALDEFNNVVTSFAETVQISDLTATITPEASGKFYSGAWSGAVRIAQIHPENVITVRQSTGVSGHSNRFQVTASSIDHFAVAPISAAQTAGNAFMITITAKDAQGNTVTDFTGTANLSDVTGTISPTVSSNFTAGSWSDTVTITRSESNNRITVAGTGKSGVSNEFEVRAAGLAHFTFETINSPRVAGQPFPITLRAEDGYQNLVTVFNEQVDLTDDTGTLIPETSGAFKSGRWSGNVTITRSQKDIKITASRDGHQGQSNRFNVNAAGLHHFELAPISTQAAGEAFPITITALDGHENVATDFEHTVNISDATGTITPRTSTMFKMGQWSGTVTIPQAQEKNTIQVTRTGGTEAGSSNSFDVISNSIDHFEISPIYSPQTAGVNFQVTITAKDAANNTVSGFSGTANLRDLTGTIEPVATSQFENGVWSGAIRITHSIAENSITVTSSGKAGTSNSFVVNPAGLDHFQLNPINSPQTAAVPFQITIIARDQFNNLVTRFTQPVNLQDNTNSISPEASGAFTSGQWTGEVQINTPQNDVQITVENTGKTGQSNRFNVVAGALHHFEIDPISTQFAGQSFVITVTARDANHHRVQNFNGTVVLTDESGSITPSTSGKFNSGQWVGNVTIRRTIENNVIHVQRTGGTERGASNVFSVIASEVDHYEIASVASPQVAGTPFVIYISAHDAANNIVTAFNGRLNLSDLTGTISPDMSGNFVNGVWEDSVVIIHSLLNNVITATNGTRAGHSNLFNVLPKPLHHFLISPIFSPQIAGMPIQISISAVDVYDNIVTSFAGSVDLAAPGAELTPAKSGNFVNGQWSGEIIIPDNIRDVFILANFQSVRGQSNRFNVEPASLYRLILRDQPGGFGNEIGDVVLTLNDKLRIYAAGYDQFGNYIRDVSVNWQALGNLEQPQPLFGRSTILDPTTPGSEGRIRGDTTGVIADTTGLITVGAISWVKIRTAAGGNGVELGDVTLSADDSIALYAAGYDAGGNYLGEVSVLWQSSGNLEPVISDTSTSQIFAPTKAPRSGKIKIVHPTATGDETGTIQIVPGHPVGRIELIADRKALPADGVSTTRIHSAPIVDRDGNIIARNVLFTVRTTRGTIISPSDASAIYDEWQVTPNDSGSIVFVIQASTSGGTAFITVNSTLEGGASGETVVNMSSLNVVSVVTEMTTVSRGQSGIPVNVVVENIGSQGVSQLNAGLKFIGPAPYFDDRGTDYPVMIRTDQIKQIPGGSRQTLSFLVSVGTVALNQMITLDAWASGYAGESLVSDSSADRTDKWRVQIPAQFSISKIEAFADTVSQGLDNVSVALMVKNEGEASAVIEHADLRFWSIKENRDLPTDYQVFPSPGNPQLIPGTETVRLNFTLNVGTTATLGPVQLNGAISGTDLNSGRVIDDPSADITDAWVVVSAARVGITSFRPSQFTVSKGQTQSWFVTMCIRNNATAAVGLDSANIKFLIGGIDITDEYKLFLPNYFMGSGNDKLTGGQTDSLRFVITRTGTTLGLVTIEGAVHLTDLQTGKSMTQSQKTGVTVTNPGFMKITRLIPSQTRVTLNQEVPWSVRVILLNEGGSDISIIPHPDSSFVTIEPESGFQITSPTRFQKSGDFILRGSTIDTLVFTVTKTGNQTGYATLTARISGYEMNTNQSVVATTTENIRIRVENPARLRLFSVTSKAPNVTQVNVDQSFKIQVRVQNPVSEGSEVRAVNLLLTSNGSSIDSLRQTIGLVPAGEEPRSAFFDIRADTTLTRQETFYAQILGGVSGNTGLAVPIEAAIDSIETMTFQTPARLVVQQVITPSAIRANQRGWWPIKVVVTDSGEAALHLNKPAVQDIQIVVRGKIQKDYIIEPPKALCNGGLILNGGETDTLVYMVTTTGEASGNGEIRVSISGNDLNSEQELMHSASTHFEIQTAARIVIRETRLRDCNIDPVNGVGLVNRGQKFRISVVVRNVGREAIEDIYVKLSTNSRSKITETKALIHFLPAEYGAIDSVNFAIEADTVDTGIRPEKFVASIQSAYVRGTDIPATVELSTDSTAQVSIMKPAELAPFIQQTDTVFAINQVIDLPTIARNLGVAKVDESGRLTLTAPAHYKIITPDADTTYLSATAPFKVDEFVHWKLITSAYASRADTIIVAISQLPVDLNSREPARVRSRHDTLIVQTLPTKLLVSAFGIVNPLGAIDGVLSQNQFFTIQAVLNFSQNLRHVTAEMKKPAEADYFIEAGGNYRHNLNAPGAVSWVFRAPSKADTAAVLLELELTANENGSRLVLYDSLWVKTVRAAELSLHIWISHPPGATDGILSTGQAFEIKAEVKNRPLAAATYGEGHIEIDFGVTNVQTEDTLIQPFKLGQDAVWHVLAPQTPTTLANIIARITDTPKDENSNEPALIAFKGLQDTIAVRTEPTGTLKNSISIRAPKGATDGILSSGQRFQIQARIQKEGVHQIYTELHLPPHKNFICSVSRKLLKAGETTVLFDVIAPEDTVERARLWIESQGADENIAEHKIYSQPDTLDLAVVKKADLNLAAAIVEPPAAQDNIVTLGSSFKVRLTATNFGMANITSLFEVEIKPPAEYKLVIGETTKKDCQAGLAEWELLAPKTYLPPRTIKFDITQIPLDENTDSTVAFRKPEPLVVTTETKSLHISKLDVPTPKSITRGETNVPVLNLLLENVENGEVSSNVLLKYLKIRIVDKNGQTIRKPATVLSRLAVVDATQPAKIYAQVSGTALSEHNVVPLVFSRIDTIYSNKPDSLAVLLDLARGSRIPVFKVTLDSAAWFDITIEGTDDFRPLIKDVNGQPQHVLDLSSDYITILDASLEKSFCNYPNPFGKNGMEKTTFIYYLDADTDLDFRIYTVLGELVCHQHFSATDPEGKQGTHDSGNLTPIWWDGKNDVGHTVLNGTYIAMLSTQNGQSVMTKTVFIK